MTTKSVLSSKAEDMYTPMLEKLLHICTGKNITKNVHSNNVLKGKRKQFKCPLIVEWINCNLHTHIHLKPQ